MPRIELGLAVLLFCPSSVLANGLKTIDAGGKPAHEVIRPAGGPPAHAQSQAQAQDLAKQLQSLSPEQRQMLQQMMQGQGMPAGAGMIPAADVSPEKIKEAVQKQMELLNQTEQMLEDQSRGK